MDFIKKIIQNRLKKVINSSGEYNEAVSFVFAEFERIKKEYGREPVLIVRKSDKGANFSVCLIDPITLPDGSIGAKIKIVESIEV